MLHSRGSALLSGFVLASVHDVSWGTKSFLATESQHNPLYTIKMDSWRKTSAGLEEMRLSQGADTCNNWWIYNRGPGKKGQNVYSMFFNFVDWVSEGYSFTSLWALQNCLIIKDYFLALTSSFFLIFTSSIFKDICCLAFLWFWGSFCFCFFPFFFPRLKISITFLHNISLQEYIPTSTSSSLPFPV